MTAADTPAPIATPEETARKIASRWGNYSAIPMLTEAIRAERQAAESLAATARRDAFEEAAKVAEEYRRAGAQKAALHEDDTAPAGIIKRAIGRAVRDALALVTKDIRSLAD